MRFIVGYIAYIVFQRDIQACSSTADVPAYGSAMVVELRIGAHGLSTYPCPEFWRIAANEGCTAIIGLDAHDNKDLETPMYYDRAVRELKELKIERIDELRMLI